MPSGGRGGPCGGGAMLPEDKAFAVGSFKKQEVVFLV